MAALGVEFLVPPPRENPAHSWWNPQLCGVETDPLRSHCGVQQGPRTAFWEDVLQNKVCKPVTGDDCSVQEKQDPVLSQVCPHLFHRSCGSEEGVLGTPEHSEPGSVCRSLGESLETLNRGWDGGRGQLALARCVQPVCKTTV